jgi:hypothetical protein
MHQFASSFENKRKRIWKNILAVYHNSVQYIAQKNRSIKEHMPFLIGAVEKEKDKEGEELLSTLSP